MKPVFMASGLRDNGYGKKVGEDKTHLKLNIFLFIFAHVASVAKKS